MTCVERMAKFRDGADRALVDGDQITARLILSAVTNHERYCRADHDGRT